MALKIIGAGFGRTGTESMKTALEILGFDPCYHMFEVMNRPERLALWKDSARGILPDWDAVFEGYQATVDWPAAFFWRELAAHYPEAKILLTVRSPESWYASMEKTILASLRDPTTSRGVGKMLIGERLFGNRLHDKAHIMALYEQNTADVQASFGAERLLTYELGSGWEPLCAFLECPVPEVAYPRKNDAAGFHARINEIPSSATATGAD